MGEARDDNRPSTPEPITPPQGSAGSRPSSPPTLTHSPNSESGRSSFLGFTFSRAGSPRERSDSMERSASGFFRRLGGARSDAGREWEAWLTDLQKEISLLSSLNADKLFVDKAQAEEIRIKVAAHVLQLKQKLDDSYQHGVRTLHEEITELSERAGFHFSFFTWAYMSRLGFSLMVLFVSAYICALASMCSGYRTPHVVVLDLDQNPIQGAHTLPDLGHDLWAWVLRRIGHTHDYVNVFSIPDTVVGWTSTFTMAFILTHPRRFLIMRRIAIVFAVLFIFRAFTVTVTSLPDASPTCVAQFTNETGAYKRERMFPKVFYRALKFVMSPTSHVTCGDMVFSGHTTVLTMCSMIFKKYCRGKLLRTKVFFRSFHVTDEQCKVMRWLVYVVSVVGALLIIGTRLHYTLDVAIAAYLTMRTFRYYHDCCKYPNIGRKAVLGRLLKWLEAEEIIAVDKEAYELAKGKG